jgi:hypothetical protein
MTEIVQAACVVAIAPTVAAVSAAYIGIVNRASIREVKKNADGLLTLLTKDLADQTAKANYLQGLVDKWIAIEKRNDLLAATPPEKK